MVEIECAAEAFLAGIPSYVWDGATLPVPIEEIADTHVGLLVRDVEDLGTAPGAPELGHGQALSGLLLPAVGEIWVNAEEARQWPARRRFTIAHELGHWRLHRGVERGVFCRSGSIGPEAPQTRAPIPPAEDEANLFAAAVLMPARLVQEQYIRSERDFFRLCDTFAASGAAMGRRLHAVIKPTVSTAPEGGP
ncbi:MAG: ImmA/IrrE family metallo-endopeptidase [Solirubrobacteraceae bacterium]